MTSQRGSLSFSNSFKRLLFLFSKPSRLAFPGLPSFFISWILVLMRFFFVVILCALYSPLLPYMSICLYKLSYLIRYSLSLCGRGGILFPQMASPCGRGGLWPPTIWYRFAYSLSPAIPSLPRDFALLQAFGLRRPSPCERLRL